MRLYGDLVVLTADDEEPKCERCINVIANPDFCCDCCGAEHYWAGYERRIPRKEWWLS